MALVLLGDREQKRGRYRLEPQTFHLFQPSPDTKVPGSHSAGQLLEDLMRRRQALDGRDVDRQVPSGTKPPIGRGDHKVGSAAGSAHEYRVRLGQAPQHFGRMPSTVRTLGTPNDSALA